MSAHAPRSIDEYLKQLRGALEGEDPATSEEWNVGHPMLFPLALAQGAQGAASFQFPCRAAVPAIRK